MKRLAMLTAAAALAVAPAAAAAPDPGKAERPAKAERVKPPKQAKPDSARARCAAERRDLGPAGFSAKYGRPRTKGRGRVKAARAAFGRCVSQTAKAIRAEREAAEDEQADLEELEEVDEDEGGDGDDGALGDDATDPPELDDEAGFGAGAALDR